MYLFILIFSIVLIFLFNIKKLQHFTTNNKKIAFCFLIYDKINNEEHWYKFFEKVDKKKYNIYIHFKKNKKLKYFENMKINSLKDTNWCGPSLVKAQNLLLKEALRDKDNNHFIFISNSCLPIKSFDYIYNHLNINKSYFYETKSHTKYFDDMIAYKSPQWCILNRKHSKLLISEDIEKLNKKIFMHFTEKGRGHVNKFSGCPDEYCYITILNHLGERKNIIITNKDFDYATTYRSQYDEYRNFIRSRKSGRPSNYTLICPEEIDFLKKIKSFFLRKVNDKCEGIESLKSIY